MPRQTASLAKLTRPRLHAALPRERLFTLLDAQRASHSVIWVNGPPGAGKTTLVASYCDARKLPALWYQVDGGDGDAATFFYYLRLAALAAIKTKRAKLPLLTPGYLPDLAGFSRRWFRELFSLLPPGALLVLDNYQDAPADSAFHAVVSAAAAEIPETATLAVISRGDPPPEFARLTADQKLIALEWDDLRLTQDETTAIAADKLDRQLLHSLYEQCDGWAAGVVLMLERFRQTGMINRIARGEAMETVFNYFAGQIFSQTSTRDQQILIRTAFLPRVTPKHAVALSGDADAGKLLDELYRRHLFTDRRLEPELTYQYHALFREFLLATARQTCATDQLHQLRRYTAELLASDRQPEAAVQLLRAAEDWHAIAGIALDWAKSFIEQGRHNALTGWFELLPAPLFEDDPWLCYWRGFALMPTDPAATVGWCERAFNAFARRQDRAGLLLSWARIIQAIRFDANGDLKQMDAWIAVADRLLTDDAGFPSEEIEYQFVYGMYVALQHRMPWHPRHNAWRDRAIALGLSPADSANRAYLAYLAVSYETQRGHLARAKSVLDAVSRVKNLSALTKSFSFLGRIQLEIEMGQSDAALRTMETGLEYASAMGIHVWDMFLRWHGGRAALLRGDIALAQRLQAEIAANADVAAAVPGFFYNYLSALIALLQGNLPIAAMRAEKAVELTQTSGWLVSEARCRLLYSRILLEMGIPAEAKSQLAIMQSMADRLDYPALISLGLLQQALLAFAGNDETDGLAALERGLKLAEELGIKETLWFCPADGSRLCGRALEAGIAPHFTRDVIRQRKLLPETPDIENWPWPLRIYTLGGFSVVLNDQESSFHGKAQKKPLEVLKALIAFGGKKVDAEILAQALWPDADGDDAQAALGVTLHRLRKLLGGSDAIELAGGKLTLDGARVWVDAWALDRLAERARTGLNSGDGRLIGDLEQKILRLYRGHFLELDAEQPFLIAVRERMKNQFVRLILQFGQQHERNHEWDSAAAIYQRGLEKNHLAEELYRRLMVCRQQQGRFAEALNVYRSCREALSIILAVKPSAATEAIHDELLRQARP